MIRDPLLRETAAVAAVLLAAGALAHWLGGPLADPGADATVQRLAALFAEPIPAERTPR